METPFRIPIIPGTHAALRLIFQNSLRSILFGYERWQTLTLISTQCAAIWISGVIILKWATLLFPLFSTVVLVTATHARRISTAEEKGEKWSAFKFWIVSSAESTSLTGQDGLQVTADNCVRWQLDSQTSRWTCFQPQHANTCATWSAPERDVSDN